MDDFVTVLATGIQLASGAVSTSATIPLMLSGESPRFIRVSATVAACVRIGPAAATAVVTDMQVQPGDSVIMHVPNGYTKFACIQVAAAGVVQVSPLENM